MKACTIAIATVFASLSLLATLSVASLLFASPVIYPDQRIPLKFSHVQHLSQNDLTCTSCHRRAERSRSALDRLIPGESACKPCHAIDRDRPAGCDACHPGHDGSGPIERVRIPVPNLKFDHAVHAERGIACQRCHGDLVAERVELATRAQLPAMSLCLGCHDGKPASRECTTCHLAAAGGRVKTAFKSGRLAPSGVLSGDAHDLGFATEHAASAQNNAEYCQKCHQKSECMDCHDGVIKPLGFHDGDYVAIHAIDARRNQPDCSACHRSQTFCVGCHSRSGVSPDGRGSDFGRLGDDRRDPAGRYHPAGWSNTGQIGSDHHALEARRNIRQCASCHREQFCVDCHTAEPASLLRVNPHPPGWAQSRRCRALLSRNPRVCLRCHVTPGEARCG